MANEAHLAQLQQGVEAWNRWRAANPHIKPDLSEADLIKASLTRVDLSEANLSKADLSEANLSEATLSRANLFRAQLVSTNLARAYIFRAQLGRADLPGANLSHANLFGTYLPRANLHGANLSHANLSGAYLPEANLRRARLEGAVLMETNLDGATLTGCSIYGIAAWNVHLTGAQQADLIVTRANEPVITVDNVEVAQFIYLLLHNENIRQVIDTVTAKAVLILGRFTPARKTVLDAIREALRRRNYLPILFDFEAPGSRDFTETVSTLAHMARFIIADLTEPSSLPKELEAIVPTLAVPVQPVLEGAARPYSMFQDSWKYPWVLPVYHYEGLKGLIATLGDQVIAPAEAKVRQLEDTRRAIAEELLKPRPSAG
jgi:uncharacterized protein YjbI with pentapeptide repeats